MQKANLKEKINVNLKTFYGKRETYSFEMTISDKLSKIIQFLIEKEKDEKEPKLKFSYNSQFRIISTSVFSYLSRAKSKNLQSINPYSNRIYETIRYCCYWSKRR